MSLIKVREEFKKYGIENRILEFSETSATVRDAALALNCEEKLIAKTLSFIINDQPILIVVAGDAKVDNHKYKDEFHIKAHMIDRNNLDNLIGHEAGGICPFGTNDNVIVYLDSSLKRFEYVYPACGSSNSAIKLSLEELEKYSHYTKWVDVCSLPQGNI